MAHRHLVLAYVAAAVIHLGYLGWIGLKYRALRRLEHEFPAYAPDPE
jgi:hypothetical protein